MKQYLLIGAEQSVRVFARERNLPPHRWQRVSRLQDMLGLDPARWVWRVAPGWPDPHLTEIVWALRERGFGQDPDQIPYDQTEMDARHKAKALVAMIASGGGREPAGSGAAGDSERDSPRP